MRLKLPAVLGLCLLTALAAAARAQQAEPPVKLSLGVAVGVGHTVQASDAAWAQRWVRAMRERYEKLLTAV